MLRRLAAATAGLVLGSTAALAGDAAVAGLLLSEHATWHSSALGVQTTYRYHGRDRGLDPASVLRILHDTEAAVAAFAEERGHPLRDCRRIDELDIYYLAEGDLNDKRRFPAFMNENLAPTSLVWGVYNPLRGTPGHAYIVLTDHGPALSELTQVHELAHYWYDRFCWEEAWTGSPESFALAFETYYAALSR